MAFEVARQLGAPLDVTVIFNFSDVPHSGQEKDSAAMAGFLEPTKGEFFLIEPVYIRRASEK